MSKATAPLDLAHPQSMKQAIESLLEGAADAKLCSKRQHARYPFFHPVKIKFGIPYEQEVSALCRDISPAGIGLLHSVNLPVPEATLAIETAGGLFVSIQARVAWSKPFGDGWYLSGMRALDVSATQALTLLVEVFARELKERWHQRYPFYHPATITLGGQRCEILSALSRDISSSGIGLIHHGTVNAKYADLRIETYAGNGLDIPIEFVWCKPCGPGIFLSGWQFWTPDIIELEPYSP